MIQTVAKDLISQKSSGSIVNIASIGALASIDNAMAYCCTKAALDMATKSFALELGPHNIRVNSVCPTLIRTPMSEKMFEDENFEKGFVDKTPLGRIGTRNDIANAVLFMLSDLSSMITGVSLRVDGGLLSSI